MSRQDSHSPSRSRSLSVSRASSRASLNGLDVDDKGSVNRSVHSEAYSEARSNERRSVHSNASGKRFSSRSASRSSGSIRRRRPYSHSRSRSRSRSSRRYRSRSRDRRDGGRDGYRGSRRSRSRSPMSNRRRHFGDRENPTPSRCIGVFGLSLHTRERDLNDIFSRYGEVENIQMVYDNYSGRSRGFCFVYFRYAEDAREAKERAHGIEIDGRNIRCDYSITERAHSPTPGVYLGRTSRRKQSPYHQRSYRRSPSPRYSRSYRRSRSRSRSYDRYDRRY